jgi:hypothetical protein
VPISEESFRAIGLHFSNLTNGVLMRPNNCAIDDRHLFQIDIHAQYHKNALLRIPI